MGVHAKLRAEAQARAGVLRRPRARRGLLPWLFLSPLLALNVLVVLGPSVGSVIIAFTDWTGMGNARWIGVANFVRMVHDPVYRIALINNLRWTAIFLTVPIAMGLLGASLLAGIRRGQILYRIAYFIPYIIASVVNAQIWRNILNPLLGIGPWLAHHGIPYFNVAFLGKEETALYTVAFVDNWHWWGFLVVVYLAAMQQVDPQLYEEARLEGAGRWQEFRYVTLPMIRPTLVFTLLMTVIWSFLVFDYIYILTRGGPAHSSEVLATEAYQAAFARFEAGYAAAVGLSMSLFTAIVVSLFMWLRRRGWEI
ncbi:sugar ABC transporter permease [Carboxydochorda subterranea]|uniref:Sugar ABC transporter permease n=1 Tax=Carboxydichorda subterranea TaxID=3109565 RepID=A0ABZ1BXG2_9FIRM|nr:sugar ABC transporter permease [Limnochorda sp. L945t]WRP17310.1 sugar ABC transporter permease [Limnochorda sp. L945t]